MDIVEIKQSVEKARENNDVLLIKGLFPKTLNWDNFIGMLDHKFNSEYQINQTQEPHNRLVVKTDMLKKTEKIVDILIFNDFDMHLFDVSRYREDLYKDVDNWVKEVFDINATGMKGLINFVGNESIYGIHSDQHDVVLWGNVGTVEWNIYKDKDDTENYTTYKIEPGDILFAPSGVIHEAVVKEPRASLIFAFNFLDKE